jgi:hypothetical protein
MVVGSGSKVLGGCGGNYSVKPGQTYGCKDGESPSLEVPEIPAEVLAKFPEFFGGKIPGALPEGFEGWSFSRKMASVFEEMVVSNSAWLVGLAGGIWCGSLAGRELGSGAVTILPKNEGKEGPQNNFKIVVEEIEFPGVKVVESPGVASEKEGWGKYTKFDKCPLVDWAAKTRAQRLAHSFNEIWEFGDPIAMGDCLLEFRCSSFGVEVEGNSASVLVASLDEYGLRLFKFSCGQTLEEAVYNS